MEKNRNQVDRQAKSLAFSAPSTAPSDTARQGGSHGDGVPEGLAAGGGLWRGRESGSHGDQDNNSVEQSAADAEAPVNKEEEEAEVRGQGAVLPFSLSPNPALLVTLGRLHTTATYPLVS